MSIKWKTDWTLLDTYRNRVEIKKWYVYKQGKGNNVKYLHKDGTIHSSCGKENFWDSEFDALEAIHLYQTKEWTNEINAIPDFISEDEMKI